MARPTQLGLSETGTLAPPGCPGLHLGLDTQLPAMAVAVGDVVYIAGWCFHEQTAIERIEFVVNGRPQRIVAWRMPRFQVAKEY